MLKCAVLEKNSWMVRVLSQYARAYELCCTLSLSVFLAVMGDHKDTSAGANLGTGFCCCVVAMAFVRKICF